MNLCTLIGHKYVAHPAGYHFCRRCGASDINPEKLIPLPKMSIVKFPDEPLLDAARIDPEIPERVPTIKPDCDDPVVTEGQKQADNPPSPSSDGGGAGGPAPDKLVATPSDNSDSTPTKARQDCAPAAPTPDPLGGGGGEGTLDVDEIRERLKAYFERTGKSAWSGAFSVSDATVHNILTSKTNGSPATLKKLREELDAYTFADETPDGEVGPHVPPVEEVPNSLPEITGLNPIPKPSAPPRHARTP